jgi:VanZ family protein
VARDLAPPGAVAALVLVLTTAPIGGPSQAPPFVPLLVHVVMFAVLAAALTWTWQRRTWRHPVLGPVLVAIAYGCATELIQLLLPHRSGAVIDVVADAAGAIAGAAVMRGWLHGREAG